MRIGPHISSDTCPRCNGDVLITPYKFGEDADGNRFEWREDVECLNCQWTPADGFDFAEPDEEDETPCIIPSIVGETECQLFFNSRPITFKFSNPNMAHAFEKQIQYHAFHFGEVNTLMNLGKIEAHMREMEAAV